MNKLGRVIGFTIGNKLRSRAFVVTTLVLAALLAVSVNLPYVIGKLQDHGPTKVGVAQGTSPIVAPLLAWAQAQPNPDLRIVAIKDAGTDAKNETAFRQALADGAIDGYLTFGAADASGFPAVTYKSKGTLELTTMGKLQNALQQVKVAFVTENLGLSDEQKAMLMAPVQLNKVQVSADAGATGGKTEAQIAMATGMVYAMVILLFMGVMISGQLIATEITAEKNSRVMEILVTSVSPLAQMFGKIIGMFVISIGQIAFLVAVAVANLSLPQNREMLHIDWSNLDPMLVFYAVVLYLLGYFLFATLYAAVGSIVSRTEDLGQAVMPITFVSMAGYFIAIAGLQNPTSMLVNVTSYVPFFAPFIMLLRLGLTDAPAWQAWLSIAILLATIAGCGVLSAKIYRTGVLMYGKRPSWQELFKAMKAYRM